MATDYVRPDTLSHAVELLQSGGDDARPIAGGQSLVPMLNLGFADPTLLVDVTSLEELSGLSHTDELLMIGAATRHAALVESDLVRQHAPMLADAATHIGSPRIRHVGTIGGSLAHADPAAELPLVCGALEAHYEVVGPQGPRTIAAQEFALGHYTTALEPGEILTSVSVPIDRSRGWGFHEYARRAGDFALLAAAAAVRVTDAVISECRVFVSGVSDRAFRLAELESDLIGHAIDDVADIAARVEHDVDPSDDPYVPAQYKRRLARALTLRAVRDAMGRATEADS